MRIASLYEAEASLEWLMIHIHSRRDGIHMWSHSVASVGGDQLETFAGPNDLVFKKKSMLEKHIIRHCACLYNWAVNVLGFFGGWEVMQ